MLESFLLLPKDNKSTSLQCTCHTNQWQRNVVKPWVKSTEERPSQPICFNGNHKERKDRFLTLAKLPAKRTRILCFYHAERFCDQSVEWIKYFTDVEELQLQFGCNFNPNSNLGGIFDYFLKLPLRTTIKSLTLDTTRNPLPFPEVLNFICSFPNLEDLRIGDIVPPCSDEKEIISQSPSPRGLTGTFISEGNSEYFVHQLLKQETVCCFREIVQRHDHYNSGVKDLVEHCSKTLECIRIHGCKSSFRPCEIGPVSDRF